MKTAHDAVYALALHRFVVARTQRGERVTYLAAEKIAAVAVALGIRPERSASELGFDADLSWSVVAMHRAQDRVQTTRSRHLVQRLYDAISDVTVGEIEGYSESVPGAEEDLALGIQDAVFTVALHRYIRDRGRKGEGVSEKAASKIAAIALVLGIAVGRTPDQLGFVVRNRALCLVAPHMVEKALQIINGNGGSERVEKLCRICCGRTVVEIESLDVTHFEALSQ